MAGTSEPPSPLVESPNHDSLIENEIIIKSSESIETSSVPSPSLSSPLSVSEPIVPAKTLEVPVKRPINRVSKSFSQEDIKILLSEQPDSRPRSSSDPKVQDDGRPLGLDRKSSVAKIRIDQEYDSKFSLLRKFKVGMLGALPILWLPIFLKKKKNRNLNIKINK